MFDRFVRFAGARRELARGHFEAALRLADDPLIRDHRRAVELKAKALAGLRRRARGRIDRADWSAALIDLDLVLQREPEDTDASKLRESVLAGIAQRDASEGVAQVQLAEARKLVQAGQLEAARELLARAQAPGVAAAAAGLARLIENRRTLAAAQRQEAEAALGDGRIREALRLLAEARAQDRDSPGAAAELRRLVVPLGGGVARAARALLGADDQVAARSLLLEANAVLPDLATEPAFHAAAAQCQDALRARVRALLEADQLAAAVELERQLALDSIGGVVDAVWSEALDAARAALRLLEHGDLAGAAEQTARLGDRLGSAPIRQRGKQLAEDARWCDGMLAEARRLAAAGDLVAARERLLDLLARWPAHAAARAEIAMLQQGADTRAKRLAEARDLAARGQLQAAQAGLLSLVVAGPEGDEARLLLKDVQARLELVAAGADQVRRWLHGRDSATREGLRHCLARIDELARIQADHPGLTPLRAAIEAEIEGHDHVATLLGAEAAGDAGSLTAAAAALRELAPRLLTPDRLSARIEPIAEAALARATRHVAAAALRDAKAWSAAAAALLPAGSSLAAQQAELEARIAEREERCATIAARGNEALAARDLTAAREQLEAARAIGDLGGSAFETLRREVERTERQAQELDQVEQLARAADGASAGRRMRRLDPSTPMLRTRIFDLKQNLARMQGLDHGFLLRVDECGEFLVLRGDTITIGNLREGSADLAVLANIAGRHARLIRSMSFHGGMQDRIEPDRGPLAVNGVASAGQRLVHGDRIRLGPVLELHYEVPSPRSLSARLTLGRGFQACGTDKVLLLKDRGRDGRLLLGPAADAHVRQVRAAGEVELFAGRDGQIRIACAGGGRIDGKPFSGEHPVLPGAFIEAGGLGFVVLPKP